MRKADRTKPSNTTAGVINRLSHGNRSERHLGEPRGRQPAGACHTWQVLLIFQHSMFAALDKELSLWPGGLGIGVVRGALRWNSLDVPLVRDGGDCAYAAQLPVCGRPPGQHSFLQRPAGEFIP